MKLKLWAIAKTDFAYLREGILYYAKRIPHYLPFEYEELSDKKIAKSLSEADQRTREGELILSKLEPGDVLFLFDERGKTMSSTAFASFFEKKMLAGTKTLVLVIGGPYGFSDEVYRRAAGQISLSAMTFSHQMIRLFAVEQIYRAMTILKGEPYHHA